MSFESWKKEFYPKDASDYINKSDKDCLKHSIKKWEGALPENVEKHQVNYKEHTIFTIHEALSFHGTSCALCQKYSDVAPDDDDCDCYSDETNEYCPIVKVHGQTCSQAYDLTRHNPTEMITLLEDTLEAIEND